MGTPGAGYIKAIPGWKHDVGKRLDALITRTVPNLRKTVKWNSPFYGVRAGELVHGIPFFNRYIKLTFFRGTSLLPVPPGGKQRARWIDIHGDDLDETKIAAWAKQAAVHPAGSRSR
jgi:hypothetical protein